jgi:hypothetical protein
MTTRAQSLLAIALLVVLFGGGVGVGIGLDRAWLRPPAPARDGDERVRVARIVEKFRRDLKLTEAQAGRVAEILRGGRARISSIRTRIQPEVRAERVKMRTEISSLLDETQRARYAEMVKRFDERRAAKARR